jgi:multiple sugar transport system permease protein
VIGARAAARPQARQRSLKRGIRVQRVIIWALLIIGSLAFAVPFLWMVSTSLKLDRQIFRTPPIWIPNPIVWENYERAVTEFPFSLYLRNTVFITGLAMAGNLISATLVAYSFAALRWPGRQACFIVLLSTMMLPSQVTMIPTFILFQKIHWVNTFLPLVVPAWFGPPFYIFLLRQFFLTIPRELADAATVDGANELIILGRIVVPLSGPALATVAIFSFVSHWNSFLGPLIYLNKRSNFTLSLGLMTFRSQYTTDFSALMAASALVLLPILVLFFVAQKYFVQGIVLTGIKA